jgi:hypothetical protein
MSKSSSYLFILILFSIIYYLLSILLLDGKFIYYTGDFRNNKQQAIADGYFLKDILVETRNEKTNKFLRENEIEFWLSKRDEYKFIGFIFNFKIHNPKACVLNINCNTTNTLYKTNPLDKYYSGVPNSIECEIGDSLTLYFNNEIKLLIIAK